MGKISGYSYNTNPATSDFLIGDAASGPTTYKYKISDIMQSYTNQLGISTATSVLSVTSSTPADMGLSLTVTVPTGARKVKVTAQGKNFYASGAAALNEISIWQGVVGSGTQLAATQFNQASTAGLASPLNFFAMIESPTPGSYTFNLGGCNTSGNTVHIDAGATYPMILMAEVC